MRAAQRARIGHGRRPPALAPVILLDNRFAIALVTEVLRDCRTDAGCRAHAPAIDGCEHGDRQKGRDLNGEPEGKGEASFGRRLH